MKFSSDSIVMLILLLCMSPVVSASDKVIVYSSVNPPYNFVTADGTADGVSTRLVRKIMDVSGLPYEIRVVSWTRAIRNVLLLENSLIFSLDRNESREQKFLWLAPLVKVDHYLIGKYSDQRKIVWRDIVNGAYSAVCVANSSQCDLLRKVGFPEASIFSIALSKFTDQYKLITLGRVDFLVSNPADFPFFIKHNDEGYTDRSFKPVMDLKYPSVMYLASSPYVKPAIKKVVQAAYERLLAEKSYTVLSTKDLEGIAIELP